MKMMMKADDNAQKDSEDEDSDDDIFYDSYSEDTEEEDSDGKTQMRKTQVRKNQMRKNQMRMNHMEEAEQGLEGVRRAIDAEKCEVSKVYWILKENREKRDERRV